MRLLGELQELKQDMSILKTECNRRLDKVDHHLAQLKQQFGQQEFCLLQMEQRAEKLDQRLEQTAQSLCQERQSLEQMELRLTQIEQQSAQSERHLDRIYGRMGQIENNGQKMYLMLEQKVVPEFAQLSAHMLPLQEAVCTVKEAAEELQGDVGLLYPAVKANAKEIAKLKQAR